MQKIKFRYSIKRQKLKGYNKGKIFFFLIFSVFRNANKIFIPRQISKFQIINSITELSWLGFDSLLKFFSYSTQVQILLDIHVNIPFRVYFPLESLNFVFVFFFFYSSINIYGIDSNWLLDVRRMCWAKWIWWCGTVSNRWFVVFWTLNLIFLFLA